MSSFLENFGGTAFAPMRRAAATVEERLRLIEDQQDIARLMSLYCWCNDGGWEGQGPSHMGPSEELFVEDGVWDDGGDLGRAEGRASIRALFNGLRAVQYVSHNILNPVIDIVGDVARGNWHMIVLAKYPNQWGTEDVDAHWVLGNYDVKFRRTEEGWRFTSMIVARGRAMPQRGYNADPAFTLPAAD